MRQFPDFAFIRRYLRDAAFGEQLGLAVTAGALIFALIASVLTSWQGSRQIHQTLREQGERIAENLASQSALALLYDSPENVSEAAQTALAFPDVLRIEVHHADGRTLLVKGKIAADEDTAALPIAGMRRPYLEIELDDSWRFIAPVLARGEDSPFEVMERREELYGFVRVVQSKARLTRLLAETFALSLAVSLLFAAGFLIVLRKLANRLTRPITDLSRAMARAERGESQVRAVISGPRDIRDMAQAFNSMMAALQERELALRESQARYREVVDGVREVIFQTDTDGAWSLLNPAWEEVTGVPVEAALGKAMADFVLAEDRATIGEWAAQLRTGAVNNCRFDVRFRRADGSCGWIEVALRPRYDGSGRFAGTSGILEDVTENRLAAERLAELNRELENRVRVRTTELEASNRELEAFSYSASHDLRAPLRAIDGFVRMVEKDSAGALNGTARSYLARVRSAAQRMSQLIDGLLELARISRTKLNRQPTDLSALAREIANELSDSEPQRCAEFEIQPDLVATVDPVLVRVVIDNLVSNAWKYSGQRQLARVVFGAEIVAGQGSEVDEAVYFVRDNGAGFDMAYAENLFRPFCRLHGDQEFAGTGIGLATVERIIRRHDGRIWAEGWVDGGAVFHFTLGDSREPARGV